MDFWGTLSNTGKNVADKAKDLGELTRLNAKLAAEEGKKAKAVAEIGRIFYEANKETLGDEYRPYSFEAKAAEKEIAALKEKIRVLRGIRCCSHCGAELGRHDIYCGICGTKNEITDFQVEEETPVKETICPVCKAIVPEGMKFCPTCGEPIGSAKAEDVQDIAPVEKMAEDIIPEEAAVSKEEDAEEAPKAEEEAPKAEDLTEAAPELKPETEETADNIDQLQ